MFSGTQRACCRWALIRDNNGHMSSKTVTNPSFPYTPILLSSKNPHAILARASTSSCTTPAGQFVCFCTRAKPEPRCPKRSSQPTSHAPTFKLAVGQAFKSGITGNLFFTVLSDFFFFFLPEFLSLLTWISLPIFCFHAIMQVQDKHQARSFSQPFSETGTTDLPKTHRQKKNGERSSKHNPPTPLSCTVQIHHTIQNPHSKVNSLELY